MAYCPKYISRIKMPSYLIVATQDPVGPCFNIMAGRYSTPCVSFIWLHWLPETGHQRTHWYVQEFILKIIRPIILFRLIQNFSCLNNIFNMIKLFYKMNCRFDKAEVIQYDKLIYLTLNHFIIIDNNIHYFVAMSSKRFKGVGVCQA